MDSRLQHPFTAIIAGPTGCGKTVFVLKLIKEAKETIFPPPEKIIYYYGEYQKIFEDYPDVEFVEGLPGSFDASVPKLIILDDLLTETDTRVTNLFTKGSHHKNLSVIYMSQNLFHKGKESRTISLNAHYIVLFKNTRDATQVASLARQMYPGKSPFMLEAFKDATSVPYGYLMIDLKGATEEKYRLRTGIFKDDTLYVYVPK